MDAPKRQPIKHTVTCPFCGSTDHELVSIFGQTLLGSQYLCHTCRSPFEAVRFIEEEVEKEENGDEL